MSLDVIFVTLLVLQLGSISYGGENEYRLFNDLTTNYNPLERPVANESDSLLVTLSVTLQQIISVDAQNQIVTINAAQQFKWKDYKLKWKPDEYNGITGLKFPPETVWKPDVLLYNSVDSAFDTKFATQVNVYSDGSVEWMPPGLLMFSCRIDITWFPFDDQVCHLKFGSWTYSSGDLDLQAENSSGMDLSEFTRNSAWDLLKAPVMRKEKIYECCPDNPYPSLFYYIVIRRKLLFYTINLIIPSVLISLMTVLGFTLPNDSGEKVTLEITILLTISFFMSMLKDMTPASSDAMPLLGAYYTCCLLLVSASVVATVLTLNLHHRTLETHKMGHVMRTIMLNWLPWLLLMRRPRVKYINRKAFDVESESTDDGNDDTSDKSTLIAKKTGEQVTAVNRDFTLLQYLLNNSIAYIDDTPKITDDMRTCLHCYFSTTGCQTNDKAMATLLLFHQDQLQKIRKTLHVIEKRIMEDERSEEAIGDWRFAAMVVDRLCLYIFSIFMVVSTCGIMFAAPNFTLE